MHLVGLQLSWHIGINQTHGNANLVFRNQADFLWWVLSTPYENPWWNQCTCSLGLQGTRCQHNKYLKVITNDAHQAITITRNGPRPITGVDQLYSQPPRRGCTGTQNGLPCVGVADGMEDNIQTHFLWNSLVFPDWALGCQVGDMLFRGLRVIQLLEFPPSWNYGIIFYSGSTLPLGFSPWEFLTGFGWSPYLHHTSTLQ